MFAGIGEALGDDSDQPGGRSSSFAKTPAEAKQEIQRLKSDEDFKKIFTDRTHPEHKDARRAHARAARDRAPGRKPVTEKAPTKAQTKPADPKPETAAPDPAGDAGGLAEDRKRADVPVVIAPGAAVNERIELMKIRLECAKLGQAEHGAKNPAHPMVIAQNYYDWICDPEKRVDLEDIKRKNTAVDHSGLHTSNAPPAGTSPESGDGAIDHSHLNRG